jgi:hypothetical protein
MEDDDAEATRTAQDVTDTFVQLRIDNEEKQRQTIILQQRLVNKKSRKKLRNFKLHLESTT